MLRDGRRGASPLRTRHLVRGEREKSRIPSSFPFHLPRGTNASWRVEASKSRTNRHVVPRERICSVVGFRASRPRVRAQRLRSRQREVKESGELLVVACLAESPTYRRIIFRRPFSQSATQDRHVTCRAIASGFPDTRARTSSSFFLLPVSHTLTLSSVVSFDARRRCTTTAATSRAQQCRVRVSG